MSIKLEVAKFTRSVCKQICTSYLINLAIKFISACSLNIGDYFKTIFNGDLGGSVACWNRIVLPKNDCA